MFRLFLVSCVLLLAAACSSGGGGGGGVPSCTPRAVGASEIGISTAAELANLTATLGGEASYVLTNDISLAAIPNWAPIGSQNGHGTFGGSLDGNCYKITDMTITSVPANAGLFSTIMNASIHNLALENVNINIAQSSNDFAGAIAGRAADSTISNSYSLGTITVAHLSVGGLVGEGEELIVTNSYSTVDINATSAVTSAGGILGRSASSVVSYSYASGDISGTYTAGGIVGIITAVGVNVNTLVHGCVAINGSISATNSGRIVGVDGDTGKSVLSNNIAWDGMAGTFTGKTASGISGEDRSATQLKEQATYEAIGWRFGEDKDNPWWIVDGMGYPTL